MNLINQLSNQLHAINKSAFQDLYFDLHSIEQEVKKLHFWLSSPNQYRLPPSALTQQAIVKLKADEQLDFCDTQRICHGGLSALPGREQYCLIDNSEQLKKLLVQVDRYLSCPRKYRRCYRGLLLSYFTLEPESPHTEKSVGSVWECLRHYLNDRVNCTHVEGVTPDWVAALHRHRNLLTSDPCSRYVQALLLQGNNDLFEDAERTLGFSGDCWVSRMMMQASVAAVMDLPDEQFRHHVSSFLTLLSGQRNATLFNSGLAKLLDRYSQIQPQILHAALRDFSIEYWNNPWLNVHSDYWSLVSSSTRKMVGDWLKVDLIENFFDLLSDNDSQNTRRQKFWIRYAGQMTDIYFLLGYYAMYNQSQSLISFRKKTAGRLLRLSEVNRDSNALVIVINNHVFIEFGMRGYAAYTHQQIPFDPDGNDEVHLNVLVDENQCLMHQDNANGYNQWEQYFDAYLYQSFRIRVSASEPPEPWRSGLCLTTLNSETFNAFCQAFDLKTNDERIAGGYLWVLAGYRKSIICEQLRAWGLSYHVGKGWGLVNGKI